MILNMFYLSLSFPFYFLVGYKNIYKIFKVSCPSHVTLGSISSPSHCSISTVASAWVNRDFTIEWAIGPPPPESTVLSLITDTESSLSPPPFPPRIITAPIGTTTTPTTTTTTTGIITKSDAHKTGLFSYGMVEDDGEGSGVIGIVIYGGGGSRGEPMSTHSSENNINHSQHTSSISNFNVSPSTENLPYQYPVYTPPSSTSSSSTSTSPPPSYTSSTLTSMIPPINYPSFPRHVIFVIDCSVLGKVFERVKEHCIEGIRGIRFSEGDECSLIAFGGSAGLLYLEIQDIESGIDFIQGLRGPGEFKTITLRSKNTGTLLYAVQKAIEVAGGTTSRPYRLSPLSLSSSSSPPPSPSLSNSLPPTPSVISSSIPTTPIVFSPSGLDRQLSKDTTAGDVHGSTDGLISPPSPPVGTAKELMSSTSNPPSPINSDSSQPKALPTQQNKIRILPYISLIIANSFLDEREVIHYILNDAGKPNNETSGLTKPPTTTPSSSFPTANKEKAFTGLPKYGITSPPLGDIRLGTVAIGGGCNVWFLRGLGEIGRGGFMRGGFNNQSSNLSSSSTTTTHTSSKLKDKTRLSKEGNRVWLADVSIGFPRNGVSSLEEIEFEPYPFLDIGASTNNVRIFFFFINFSLHIFWNL